jgi:hypothetical protein
VLREAEVEHLGVAAVRDEEVARLDVAVDNAGRVCRGEGVGNLLRQGDRLADVDRPSPQTVCQRLAVEKLEDEERRADG